MSFTKAYGKKKKKKHKTMQNSDKLKMKKLNLFRTALLATILASDKTSRCDVSQTVR